MKITRYGLFHKKEKRLLTSIPAKNICCRDMQYTLTTDSGWSRQGSIWLVPDYETAEQARIADTTSSRNRWWNADYSTPTNLFSPDELEVVQIEMVLSKKE